MYSLQFSEKISIFFFPANAYYSLEDFFPLCKCFFLIAAENCITKCRWCELYSADETDRGLCCVVRTLFLN